ncbi:MAG: tetratricopeptide repeat protein [Bacteroidia bacterium]
MKRKIYSILFSLLIVSVFSVGQNTADSLKNLLSSSKEDTAKVNVLIKLSDEFRTSNINQSLEYANQALRLSEQLNFTAGLISSNNSIGIANYFMSNYPQALSHYIKCTKILEKTGNKKKLAAVNSNIALIYQVLKQYKDAENYFQKSLSIDEELGDSLSMAESYNNIATIYQDLAKNDIALTYNLKALKIREAKNDKEGLPSTLSNLGVVFMNMKDYKHSAEYLVKALHLYKTNSDSMGVALAYANLGDLYESQKSFDKSLAYYDSSITISKKNKYLDYLSYNYQHISFACSEMKDFEKALDYHKLFMDTKDSIYNKENAQQLAEMQTKYETEKKEKEIIESKAESEKQSNLKNAFIIGFILMVLLAYFIFRGYVTKKRSNEIIIIQKQEVEIQKEIVELKSKEIHDSINYAKRIQEAILPPENSVKQLLPDSFVLYIPKDIVSGDFYWIEPWGDKVLFAVVDCTGHGVPGALMSIVGYNLLGKALNELGLSRPSLILNSLSKGIGKTLRQTGTDSEVKDGMDIALCALDYKTKMLEYAGAFNPLYVIREGKLIEIHPDKNPIGTYLHGELKNYTHHEIQLQKGDTVYIFSDGYADQFGGDKGKKFKYKSLQQLLISIQDKSMTEQKNILIKKLKDWQGNLEQVDDILIMGVRI